MTSEDMRDSAPVNSKMINRNWVLKRKRGKHPYSPDATNGIRTNVVPSEPAENASSELNLKTEISSRRVSRKKKGNDGVTSSPPYCHFHISSTLCNV